MRAKVRKTGEIIEVEKHSEGTYCVYYKKVGDSGNRIYPIDELEFLEDEKPSITDNINWDQRRFELVKEIVGGMMSAINIECSESKRVAELCIEYADSVIAKLKEE